MKRSAMAVLALWSLLLIAGPAAAQADTTTVTLVHGFRGLLADVYLDGDVILEGFEPARSTDPTELPAGEHTVAIREADTAADSDPLLEETLDLPAGANLSAVVHPDTDGNPTISVFDNDFSAPAGDQALAVVRHTAVAPAITVTIGDATVADGLQPGEESDGSIDPGADEVTTSDAGSSEQILPPTRVMADTGGVLALYLIGSLDDDNLGWLSQRLDASEGTTPLGVPTGDSGLVATNTTPWWAWAAGALALLTALQIGRLARAEVRAGR